MIRLCLKPDNCEARSAKRLCRTCNMRARHADPAYQAKLEARMKPVDTRFWSKVDKSGECWTWTDYCTPAGYGIFKIRNVSHRAHRMALILSGVEVPSDMFVLHSCDNPSCVRPDHLRVGTPAENSTDMVERGRSAKGVKSPRAKLTPEAIPQIRSLIEQGVSQYRVAAEFGVSRRAIGDVINRKSWASI